MGLKKQITKKAVAIFLTFATAMTAVSPRMVSADTPKEMEADAFEYEDEVFEGYLAAPWDEERVAPVDKNLHYIDVQEMLVDWDDAQTTDAEKNAGEESGEPQPTDSPEPTDTPEPTDPPEPTPRPSRFPDFDTEDEILAYLTGRYPATRNQTTDGVHYGNCWAHAACTLAEFYLINHNIQDKTGPMTKDVNYSELQLAYFAYHNCPEPISGPTEDSVFLDTTLGTKRNFLNFGGNLALGSQSLLRRKGYAADADEARYENAKNVLENGLSDDYADSRDLTYLKNAFVVNLWENASLLKEAIKANGAVGVTYNSDPKYLNPETNAYYNYEKDFFNHVVTAVGWDDGYPAANFKTLPPGDGAWLIRNSHSTDTRFSEESYFWISYYDTSLGQASYIYEMADPDKGEFYDNQYYYDGQLHSIKSVASTKVANIFIAQKETETLKAVQFDASEKAPGAYRVLIYKNLTDANNPESGILMEHAVTTGTLALPGKYTLPLAAEVPLSLGETFAVVVESENPIDRECDNLWKEQLVMDVTMHHQESFYFTNDAWVDLAEKDYKGARGNLCIRALTNDRADGLPEYIANLVLRDNTEDGLSLTWSAAKDAEGYVIRRLAENDGSGDEDITFDEYLSIGTTAANERAFTDTELLADIFCCYKSIPIVGGVLDEDGASPIIRVKRPLPAPKEIVLNETALQIVPGHTFQLTAAILPKKAPGTIAWTSGSPSVCAVDENGLLTAFAEGAATIRAMTENGVKAYCKVTVAYHHVTEVLISEASLELITGETLQLTASPVPEDSIDGAITWSSSAPEVADVSDGLVTAKAPGVTVLFATAENGIQAFCILTVKLPPVTEVILDLDSTEMSKGDTLQLSAVALPEGAADPEILWASTDPAVVSVDEAGLVTANAYGSCSILAGTRNGTRAFCNLVVTPPPVEKVTLSDEYVEAFVGRSLTLSATTSPEDAVDANVIWSSSDQWIAAVSPAGFVTVYREGSCTITAFTANGTSADCVLLASYPHVTNVTLNKTDAELRVGFSTQLSANAVPEDAIDKAITWSSSNSNIASVDENGFVTALRCGSCKITAVSENGVEAVCAVTVKQIFVYECEKKGIYRYTADAANAKKLVSWGWTCRKVFRAAGKSSHAVYWIYDEKTGVRRYTLSRSKAKKAVKAGKDAGFAFYGSDAEEVPVYELYKSGKRPTYFYTASKSAAKAKVKAGFTCKGIAWYAERTTLG